jgi:hypothetical protein
MPIEKHKATSRDVESMLGQKSPVTFRGWVWKLDGEAVAIAGYYLTASSAVVFSDIRGDVSKFKIWREAVAAMKDITIPAICVATRGSERFLERLGWEHVGPSEDGEVYKCNYS